MRAIGFWPALAAASAEARTKKAAPSLMPEALPAVTVLSFLKAGFILASDSFFIEDNLATSGLLTISRILRLEVVDGNNATPRFDGEGILIFTAETAFGGRVRR